jgi:hypothetical protein
MVYPGLRLLVHSEGDEAPANIPASWKAGSRTGAAEHAHLLKQGVRAECLPRTGDL